MKSSDRIVGSCTKVLKHVWNFIARCKSGLCLQKEVACNGKKECDDGSDETIGCELFPAEGCASWFGREHVRCTKFNNTLDSDVRYLLGNDNKAIYFDNCFHLIHFRSAPSRSSTTTVTAASARTTTSTAATTASAS